MSKSDQLTLFGVDLSTGAAHLRLGVTQILLGDEAGLKAHMYPPAEVIHLSADDLTDLPPFELTASYALVLPGPVVLLRELKLPSAAEIFLGDVVAAEVASAAPFAPEDTLLGWRISARDTDSLLLRIAVTSKRHAESALAVLPDEWHSRDNMELWAQDGESYIVLAGFGESRRLEKYKKKLLSGALRGSAALLGLVVLLSLPAIWLSQSADKLLRYQQRVEAQTEAVVRVRDNLFSRQEKIDLAENFFATYPGYRPWLHTVAELTADSVFFNRMSFDRSNLTVSGLAANAADYQTELATSGRVSSVNAPSAFTRDVRAGKERFTLVMTLGEEAR